MKDYHLAQAKGEKLSIFYCKGTNPTDPTIQILLIKTLRRLREQIEKLKKQMERAKKEHDNFLIEDLPRLIIQAEKRYGEVCNIEEIKKEALKNKPPKIYFGVKKLGLDSYDFQEDLRSNGDIVRYYKCPKCGKYAVWQFEYASCQNCEWSSLQKRMANRLENNEETKICPQCNEEVLKRRAQCPECHYCFLMLCEGCGRDVIGNIFCPECNEPGKYHWNRTNLS